MVAQIAVVGSGVASLMAVRSLCGAISSSSSCSSSCADNINTNTINSNNIHHHHVTWFTARKKMGATQMACTKSTVAVPTAGEPFFDYGCQYMSPMSTLFDDELKRWQKLGLAQPLDHFCILDAHNSSNEKQQLGPGWVGNGGMGPMLDGLIKQTVNEYSDSCLSHVSGFPETKNQTVSLRRQDQKWYLDTKDVPNAFGPFDFVIGAFSHPKRTDPFLSKGGKSTEALMESLRGIKYNQFFALQVILDSSGGGNDDIGFGAAHVVNDAILSFVSDNSRKPGQDGEFDGASSTANKRPHMTLLSTASFAKKENKSNRKQVQERMLASFANCAFGLSLEDFRSKYRPRIHRLNYWQDGLPINTPSNNADGFLYDADQKLGWCGDFCVAPCVDGAAQSGVAVAEYCWKDITNTADGRGGVAVESILPNRNEWIPFATKLKSSSSTTTTTDCGTNSFGTVDIGSFGHLSQHKDLLLLRVKEASVNDCNQPEKPSNRPKRPNRRRRNNKGRATKSPSQQNKKDTNK